MGLGWDGMLTRWMDRRAGWHRLRFTGDMGPGGPIWVGRVPSAVGSSGPDDAHGSIWNWAPSEATAASP